MDIQGIVMVDIATVIYADIKARITFSESMDFAFR